MFSLLTNSQIYGLQAAQEQIGEIEFNRKAKSNSLPPLRPQQNQTQPTTNHKQAKQKQHRRTNSSLSVCGGDSGGGGGVSVGGTGVGSKFFGTISSMQGMKSPTNFIEKFIKTDLLSGYDTLKNYKQQPNQHTTASVGKQPTIYSALQSSESILNGFNCLQGSYRSNCDGEFYEAVHIKPDTITTTQATTTTRTSSKSPEMTIRCSKNLLADTQQAQGPATLQNYQKLSEYAQDLLVPLDSQTASSSLSSGASSGEFNTDAAGHTPSAGSYLYKKLSFGARLAKHGGSGAASDGAPNIQGQEINSDNSSSSLSTNTSGTTCPSSAKTSEVQRSSSGSSTSHDSGSVGGVGNSSGSAGGAVRKKTVEFAASANVNSPERIQRRKLLQMISAYDQQNKILQRELAKEKRRRSEELACVVKSLICFESKLKTDMKSVNQRLQDKDNEICRLVRQNRALRKKLANAEEEAGVRDEGVVVGGEDEEEEDSENVKQHITEQDNTMIDCLVLEALQCINCRKQFYDIEVKESCTQTLTGSASVNKECSRGSAHNQHEHGSSSDDTVSSSFYGARRSVRYTSKRTAGTFRDYMRSRAMNIDDPALEQGSEENTSTISREDSQTSYEQLHNYSRAIERMHGVQAHESSEQSSLEMMRERSASRMSNKSIASRNSSNSSSGGKSSEKAQSVLQLEEDDGIFSPTQDDEDYEEDEEDDEEALIPCGAIKIVQRRTTEFSEASPKQIYETSTDDWYASASDQEDQALGTAHAAKSYGNGAVNPVLECVNQILLQQSMEESVHESPKPLAESTTTKLMMTTTTTPKTSLITSAGNLPRRSSLSGRRSSMQEYPASGGGGGIANVAIINQRANSTLTRKRVHFSTKNSMVHVPRNDEPEDESDTASETAANQANQMISQNYHTMAPVMASTPNAAATTTTTAAETLNYESIYSNEYEPIGSEHPSHLYVDMDAATVKRAGDASPDAKFGKLPPALPPKPANLLKFKKSLQQLDEVPDEQDCAASTTTTTATEPDYCSISEVNVAVTCVQIVADVHKAPSSDTAPPSELDLEVSTVASDDTFAASQKTEEIEEIFADIPKLPNVAAIIAPKQAKYQPTNADYLTMTPKTPINNNNMADNKLSRLNATTTPLKLQLSLSNNSNTPVANGHQSQYKRKHVPNILAEINKRMSLPNSPTTAKAMPTLLTPTKSKSILKLEETHSPNLPLQAEFDWYNLDAEYGKTATLQPDLLKSADANGNGMLAEIEEVSECVVGAADEYNLDEEFNMAAEEEQLMVDPLDEVESVAETAQLATIKSAIYSEHSPLAPAAQSAATPVNVHKSKKIKKNLANFEKFIEGSGLSTKPLPSKRKIYFSGPFV